MTWTRRGPRVVLTQTMSLSTNRSGADTSSRPMVRARKLCSKYAEDRKSTRLNSSHMSISYAVFCLNRRPPGSTLFPYTTLFRSAVGAEGLGIEEGLVGAPVDDVDAARAARGLDPDHVLVDEQVGRRHQLEAHGAGQEAVLEVRRRSEEHTSELQSHVNLVCRLLLEPSTTGLYTLSLHDALPICCRGGRPRDRGRPRRCAGR